MSDRSKWLPTRIDPVVLAGPVKKRLGLLEIGHGRSGKRSLSFALFPLSSFQVPDSRFHLLHLYVLELIGGGL
jgi:hypothetical protein